MKYLIIFLAVLLLNSCGEKKVEEAHVKKEDTKVEETHDDHSHEHAAPNGGILTEVGEHHASLEWLIEENQLKVYIFDGCAEKPIRLAQKEILVSVKTDKGSELKLLPVKNALTGEKEGDANTFAADAPNLSKDKISSISVHSVTIQGINYKNVNLKVK